MVYKKKANFSVLVGILLILVSGMVIFGAIRMIPSFLDDGLQRQLCSANVIGAHSYLESSDKSNPDSLAGKFFKWTLDGSVEKSLKSPLCSTKVETIDLSHVSDQEELNQEVGRVMGELIQACWSTFGEGQIDNVFGTTRTSETLNTVAFFFTCYDVKFKFHEGLDVSVEDLINYDKGWLWRYNVNGRELNDGKVFTQKTYFESLQKFLKTLSKDDLSYGGYVFLNNGFIEFTETPTSKYVTESDGSIKKIALSDNLAYNAVYQNARTFNIQDYSESSLDKLYSNRFYEIRFYSQGLSESSRKYYGRDDLNNIKIVPIGTIDHKTDQIEGTGIYT